MMILNSILKQHIMYVWPVNVTQKIIASVLFDNIIREASEIEMENFY